MNDRQISCFLSAAETLNFTEAAHRNYTTQPTVSRQILLLEEELGFPLFERVRGKLYLTPGGMVLAKAFREIQHQMFQAIEEASRVTKNPGGRLSIGYISGLNTDDYIYPLLSFFIKTYDDIELQVEASSLSELREKLRCGKYDIIFTYNFELPALEEIIYEKIYAVEPLIAMSCEHPLAKKEACRVADFNKQTFLLPTPKESTGRENDLRSICHELGVQDITIKYVGNIESILLDIRLGTGVSLISSAMSCVHDNRYHCFPLPKTSTTTSIAAAWKNDNLNPAIPLFMATVHKFQLF